MTRCTPFVKAAFAAAFTLCFTSVTADHPGHDDLCPAADMTSGPVIADTLITSYISVDYGNGTALCGMKYRTSLNVTLYQGMLCASQQHGSNFQFTSTLYATLGHFIDSINNVEPMDGFYWFLFDNATLMTTPVGVDGINLADQSAYIWYYTNGTDHVKNYTGPCADSSVIPPPMPLIYKVAYLSISSANGDLLVCKKPVLIPASSTTAFTLLVNANDQIPLSVQAVLHVQNNTVTAFNGVANDGGYIWTGYPAGSNEQIPYDLSMTSVSDGDHIEFKFIETDVGMEPGDGAPSLGQPIALLFMAALLAGAMTSV